MTTDFQGEVLRRTFWGCEVSRKTLWPFQCDRESHWRRVLPPHPVLFFISESQFIFPCIFMGHLGSPLTRSPVRAGTMSAWVTGCNHPQYLALCVAHQKPSKKQERKEGKGKEMEKLKERIKERKAGVWCHQDSDIGHCWFHSSSQEEQLTTVHGQGTTEKILKNKTKQNRENQKRKLQKGNEAQRQN